MAYSQLSSQRRTLAFIGVAALHLGALVLIARYAPTADIPHIEAAPIAVTLVQPPPVVAAPEPRPPKPAPAPRARRPPPAKAPPLIAAPAAAPAPAPVVPEPTPAPAPLPLPAPVAAAPIPDAPPPEAQPPVQLSRAGPAEPVPVMPPSFNANYLNNPAPAYPSLSRRLGEEGRVMVRVRVNEQGAPERVELRASSGHARLDEVALDTVKRWKFVPARRGDQPVAAWVLVPISFNLRS